MAWHTRTAHTIAIAAALMATASHADTRLQLSTGANYSSGDYDEATRTGVVVVPIAARISSGAWSIRASVPFISVDGPADVSEILDDHGGDRSSSSGSGSGDSGSNSGSGSSGSSGSGDGSDDDVTGSGTGAVADRTASGLGDATLAVTYSFDAIASSPAYVDLTARVRLPTGSESDGLSVGATDYHALAELGWDGDAGGMFIGGGRRFLGDNSRYERVDGWQTSAGGWINIGEAVVIGAQYDWRNASTRTGTDPSSLDAYIAWRMSDAWKVELNGGVGLSDASADYNVGITIVWRSTKHR